MNSKNHTSLSTSFRLGIEIGVIAALYAVYTLVRNLNEASTSRAYAHARTVIRIEKDLFIYIERPVHEFFLHAKWLIIACNYFYGSLHFIVTLFALFYVFFKDRKRFNFIRTTIVSATLFALVGFLIYPLMPPRLLPHSYGFIDTLAKYPTFWSFDSKDFAAISNQFAAMPSVHIAWSTWCMFALLPYVKNRWQKYLVIAYPFCTLFVIVVTANHYLLDAVGGLFVLFLGYCVSRVITSLTTRSAIDNTASLAEINAK
jgi:hypothetical protein